MKSRCLPPRFHGRARAHDSSKRAWCGRWRQAAWTRTWGSRQRKSFENQFRYHHFPFIAPQPRLELGDAVVAPSVDDGVNASRLEFAFGSVGLGQATDRLSFNSGEFPSAIRLMRPQFVPGAQLADRAVNRASWSSLAGEVQKDVFKLQNSPAKGQLGRRRSEGCGGTG